MLFRSDAAPEEPVDLPPVPEEPKDAEPPAPPMEPEQPEPPAPAEEPEQPEPPEPALEPDIPSEPDNVVDEPVQPGIEINFYHSSLTIPSPEKIDLRLQRPVSNDGLADTWKQLAQTELQPAIEYINEVSERMLLNDWGFLKLTQNYAEKMFPGNTSKQLLLD